MDAILPDGRTIEFPDGTPQSVVEKYIAKYHPAPTEEPNILERGVGHISKGVGRALEMVDNFSRYSGLGLNPAPGQRDEISPREFFNENRFARQVTEHPETGLVGQLLGGAAEFLPQLPIYTAGGGTVLRGATLLPKVGRFAAALLTKGASPLGNYGKAVARGVTEGGVVGGTIGVAPGTSMEERAIHAGEEAAGFGAAVAVLHPALAGLGFVGKGIIRRLRGKATLENVEAELAKKAETDPQAAEDLQKLRTAREAETPTEKREEDLYVPKGEEAAPIRRQGELDLEPLPPETVEKFRALGYNEADLAGRSDKELIDILEKGIRNDKANEPGISGGERGGEAAKQGEPIKSASEEAVAAGGDVQALEGKTAPKEIADFLAGRERRVGKKKRKTKEESQLDDAIAATEERIEQKTTTLNEELNKPVRDESYIEELHKSIDGEVARHKELLERKKGKSEAPSVQNPNIAHGNEKVTQEIGEKLGLTYNGTMGPVGREVFMFTEPIYGATFSVKAGEDIAAKLAAKVKEFEAAGNKPIEARPEEVEIAKAIEPVKEKVDVAPEVKEAAPEKVEAAIEKVEEAKPETVAEVVKAARELDDPTVDTLIDGVPLTKEDIDLSARRNVIAKRAAELKRRKEAAKEQAAEKKGPKTRAELEAFLAEKRKARGGENATGKARRDRQKAEIEAWEKKLEEEGMGEKFEEPLPDESFPVDDSTAELNFGEKSVRTYEDIEDGVYLDNLGLQSIYNMASKVIDSLRTQKAAPSNRIVAEVNGKKLTTKEDAEFVDSTLHNLAHNFKELYRFKVMSPDFAFRNNEKMEPLVTDLHMKFFEGNFAASKRNEIVRVAQTYVPEVADQEMVKGVLEGKTLDAPAHVQKAADLIRKELDAVREKYKDYLRSEMKKNLNEDENMALAEILSGKDIDVVVAKFKEHTVLDKLGRRRVRKWLDEAVIRDIAKEYAAIDKWGLDDYVTHYERGTLRIVSGGKLYAKAISTEDAARKFADLIEMYPDKEFQLDTKHDLESLATGLSRRSYNRVLANLQKGLQDTLENINSSTARRLAQKGLEGRFFIKPTKQFSPYTMDRHEFLQGEKNVFDILYNYMYSMEKKMALDPAIDNIRRAISKVEVVGTEAYKAKDGSTKIREIKKPYLKEEEARFLERYIEDVKGKLYKGDELVDALFKNTANPRMYSRAIQVTREVQANLKLGYAPVKGFINGMSALGHVWTKVGTGYVNKGMQFLRTAEGEAFIKDMEPYLGVNIVESATGELSTRGTFEKMGILKPPKTSLGSAAHAAIEPLGLFQAPELPARKLTLAANYLMAKEGGLPEDAARIAAIKANWFQQFTYDMASLPELMRSPTGRLVTQFKPYFLKEMEFISTLRGPEIARYIGMQVALGGPRGLLMIAKSLPIIGAYGGWTELENWMNKEHPVASRGIGGLMGVDITAAATFQFPSSVRDWLGPTISDLMSLHKNVWEPIRDGEGFGAKEASAAIKGVFPIFRHWANVFEQVVDKDGWVKDDRGRRLWHIDNMATFVTKSVAGAEPIELNRIRVAEYNLTQKSMQIADQKTKVIDDILEAVANGEPIDEETLQKRKELGIKLGTLRRAAQFRVRDPKMRRLLSTELIRRPEILEMYPDQTDLQ